MPVTHPIRRVLMTADTVGGVWTFCLDLMTALGDQGVRFALATMGRRLDTTQREALDHLPHVELLESEYKLEWMAAPWRDVDAAGEWLLEIAEDFQPDVIHLNGYCHGNLPWQKPVLITAHSCVYSWFAAVKKTAPAPAQWSEYRERVHQGLAGASLVTAPTRAMLAELQRHYPGSYQAAQPIHNGRSRVLFQPGPKQPYILSAGRLWDDAKNIRTLEAAAPQTQWPIRIAGEDQHPDGGAPVFNGLHPLGFLSPRQFARELSHAAIYALPARYEPFGLSALEAAMSGCALVLSDIPTLRELWQDAAIFVPPDEPDAWSETFGRLARDSSLRHSLGERALKRSCDFSSRRTAEAYLRAYRAIANHAYHFHENSSVLPLTPVGLEPRQRAFSARLRH
jgi:glycogen synthase